VERVLIHVNSRIITQSAFDARFDQVVREEGPPASTEKADEMKKKLLEELVNEALLEDRARDLDLITTDKEVEDQIRHLKEQNKVTTDEEFEKALASSGLTIEKLRDQFKRTLTLQRVVGREVNSKVDLSDDALRLEYEREKEKWRIPEKAHLYEILISRSVDAAGAGTAEKRAREAADALKAGTKFEVVVKEYSDGSTKNRGGDLGWVARGELVPEIDRAVFSLPVGAVSDPISTKFGWHLVKVVEKSPVSYKPFSEVKGEILKKEQESQFQKRLAEYLDKIKRDAVIRVSAEAAPYYTPPPPPPHLTIGQAQASTDTYGVQTGPETKERNDVGFEITPTFGYQFGGTTSTISDSYIDKIGIPAYFSWGATIEYRLASWVNLELLWNHQNTELQAKFTTAGIGYDDKLSHLNVDTLEIGGLLQSGDPGDAARLYLDLLVGATQLLPSPQYQSLIRISGSVGGGVKYFFADHFGARLGIRWLPVYINSQSGSAYTCSPYLGCYYIYGTNYLSQIDAYTGVTWRF
jgi:parvulin-like peptidyl-prolyl isomerase